MKRFFLYSSLYGPVSRILYGLQRDANRAIMVGPRDGKEIEIMIRNFNFTRTA